jgi:hypothetical protein
MGWGFQVMITTSRINAFSHRLCVSGRPTSFFISDLAHFEVGSPPEWTIFEDSKVLPAHGFNARCVDIEPHPTLSAAVKAASCLTLSLF